MTVTASRSAELYKATLRPEFIHLIVALVVTRINDSDPFAQQRDEWRRDFAQWMQANDLSPKTWERAEPLSWRVADPRRMQGMTAQSSEYICAAMAFADTLSSSNVAERAGGRWPGPDAAAQHRNGRRCVSRSGAAAACSPPSWPRGMGRAGASSGNAEPGSATRRFRLKGRRAWRARLP
jgi:hypothetical protein